MVVAAARASKNSERAMILRDRQKVEVWGEF